MQLQKDYYLKQLCTLKSTEEHMKSLAIYTRAFGNDSDIIVGGIEYVRSQSSIHHRLVLYYLINEILMTERDSSSILRPMLKGFVKMHFHADLLAAAKFDVLYRKFVELEKVWKLKTIIDFEGKYSLEDVLSRIRGTFQDKQALLELICELKEYYEHNGEI